MLRRRDLVLGVAAGTVFATQARADPASEDETRAILRDRIDLARQSVGMVVCSFDSNQHKIVAHGAGGGADNHPLDGDSVFEIGSITKVFTALLLADMVTRGDVKLDDPVANDLPANVRMPTRSGRQITFLDLATNTSGLPRIPDNLRDGGSNPYAAYAAAHLYAFLSGHALRFDPGAHYEYSNLGFGLLGHALSLKANARYEDLVVSRICVPLGLADTRITLTGSMRERLARGHLSNLKAGTNWDFAALAGAGALRSTANDLLKLMRATCFADAASPLRAAADLLLQTRRATDRASTKAGLGWAVTSDHGDEIVWKDGLTGSYASYAGFSTRRRAGAIVLANAANPVNDLGLRLTNPAFTLAEYPPQVSVDPALLAQYEGTYRMTPAFALVIRAEAGRLFVRGSGQPEYELFAEADNRFFMRFVDAQGTFLRNKDGVVDRLLWHQGGRYRYCLRVP